MAWARERAPVVFVRLDGESFRRSAGERPYDPDPALPLWPPSDATAGGWWETNSGLL